MDVSVYYYVEGRRYTQDVHVIVVIVATSRFQAVQFE